MRSRWSPHPPLPARRLPATALPVLAVWGSLAAAVAGWAYRRDEGRRFR